MLETHNYNTQNKTNSAIATYGNEHYGLLFVA